MFQKQLDIWDRGAGERLGIQIGSHQHIEDD